MKTKFYTLLAAVMLSAPAFAFCGDSTSHELRVDLDSKFKYWQGLDIGVNGYFDGSGSIATPAGYGFLELDYARSRSIGWNIAQHNFHLYKNYINLVTGIGLEWNSYALRRNVSLATDADTVSGFEENFNFSKNKLKSTWVTAPLMIEFNTSKNDERSIHIGFGASISYNIFRNRLKQEFDVNGDEQKRKTKDDFNINPFRYSLTARAGYGHFSVFANYGLSTLFKENRGPKVYPFSAGISFSF